MKTDISNHFPIFFIFNYIIDSSETREEFIYKRNESGIPKETLKQKLSKVNWNEVN